jgi:IS30 family transposase
MKHISESQRYYIELQLKQRVPVAKIAKALGYSRQAIYAEIKRGTYMHRDSKTYIERPVYAYDVGQRVHDENKHRKGRKRKLYSDDKYLLSLAEWILNYKYSPEAARYRVGNKLCVKSIYNYVYAGLLPGVSVNHLPYARPKKRKKNSTDKKAVTRGRSIEERPDYINKRQEFGHWEMDTVYSSKDDLTCLLVLSERMSRKNLIFQIPNRTASSVVKSLDKLERRIGTPAFRRTFKSITCDNGKEFSDWELIERSCRTKGKRTVTYFCHPYCSGERGTNENNNRFPRRWIPKGDDIGLYSRSEITRIEQWMNDYPRGNFGGLSASEYIMLAGLES